MKEDKERTCIQKRDDNAMIEVLFGESEAGSMKTVKGKKIPGDPDKVVCLGFRMDIGDIRKSVDSQYRKELINSMYVQEQYGRKEETDLELRTTDDLHCNELERLRKYLKDGEMIRVWYSDAPYSICGFYSLCGALQNYENEIRVVKLPEYTILKDGIVLHSRWGEVDPETFLQYLSWEKILSGKEVKMYAQIWDELKEDNSPLRAVVNGRVLGVPEDFYDFLIWKQLTDKQVKEAYLIGMILGSNQIGIGDWWYEKRIDNLIQQGKIKVTEDSENKFARMICLAGA